MVQKIIKDSIDMYYEKAKELGDYLTNHPEISGKEENSCKYITEFLKTQGYEITAPYAGMPYSFLAVDKRRQGDAGKRQRFYASMTPCRKWDMPVGIPLAVETAFWQL